MSPNLSQIIQQYKADNQSVYNTWFINNEERLKAFRSIRRGVMQVINDIKCKRFPNDFKGSSLEFVLTCITEQKQVFEGAAHLEISVKVYHRFGAKYTTCVEV